MGDTSGKSELDKYGVWVKNTVHPTADNNEEITSPIADDKDFLENTAISKAIATEVSKLDESPLQEMPTLQTDVLSSFIEQNAQAALLPPDTRAEAQNVDETAAVGENASEDTTAFAQDNLPPHGAQENGTSDIDLSAFTGDSFGGDVDLSAFMDDTPSPAGAQQESDGEVDLSAFMDSSPASSPDGEVDLSDFLGGGDGEIDLSSFMGDSAFASGKEEAAQVQDEEPLDLDLEFEDAPFEMQDESSPSPSTATNKAQDVGSTLDDYQSLLGGFAQEASQMQEVSGIPLGQQESLTPSSQDEEIDLSAFGFDDDPEALPAAGNGAKEKKVEAVVDYVMNVDIEDEEESEKQEVKTQSGVTDDTDDTDDIKVDISQDSEIAEQKKQETDFSSPDDSFDLDAIFSNIEDESGNTVNFFTDDVSSADVLTPDAKPEATTQVNEEYLPQAVTSEEQIPTALQTAEKAQETQAADAAEAFLQAAAQAANDQENDTQVSETASGEQILDQTQIAPAAAIPDEIDEEGQLLASVDSSQENATEETPAREDIESSVSPVQSIQPAPIMEDEGFAEGRDFLKEAGLLEDEDLTAQAFPKGDTVVQEDEIPAVDEWETQEEDLITDDELAMIENAETDTENSDLADIVSADGTQESPQTEAEITANATQGEGTEGEFLSTDDEELESLEDLELTDEEQTATPSLTEDARDETQSEDVQVKNEDTTTTAEVPLERETQERPLTLQADELASFHEPVPELHEAALDMAVLSEHEEADDTAEPTPLQIPQEQVLPYSDSFSNNLSDNLYNESEREPIVSDIMDEIASGKADEPVFDATAVDEMADEAETNIVEEYEQKIENDEVETMNDEEKKKADELDVSSYIDKGPDYDMTGVTVTLDDLEKMEETPVVEPESPYPVPQEESAAQEVQDDGETQMYSVFVCNETTSSGEIEEEELQEETAEPKELESVAILQKIAQELESLKAEISGLRDEFEQLKQSGISASSTHDDESATQEGGGFFNDDDGDETIALSGDELSNILSTAEFTSQDAETLEQEEKAESTPELQVEQPLDESETQPQVQEEQEETEEAQSTAEPQESIETEQANEESTAEVQQVAESAAVQPSESALEVQQESETAETAVTEDTTQEATEAEPVTQPTTQEQEDVTAADNAVQTETQNVEPEIEQTTQQLPEAETVQPQEEESEPVVTEATEVEEAQEPLSPESTNEEAADADVTQQAQQIPTEQEEGSVEPENQVQEEAQPVQETSDEGAESTEQTTENSQAIDEQPVVADSQEQTDEAQSEIAEYAVEPAASVAEPQVETTAEDEAQTSASDVQDVADEAQSVQCETQQETPDQQTSGVITEEDIPSPTLESLNLPTLSETYNLQEEEAEPLTEDNIEYLKSDVPEELDEEEDEENIETGISEQPVDVFSNWGAKGEIEEETSEPEVSATTEGEEEISVPKPAVEPSTPPAATVVANAEPEAVQEEVASEPVPAEQVAEPKAEGITSDLMTEIKAVLTYMDKLLENLPDEKIEEVAHSEQFETYKKLFVELGLA